MLSTPADLEASAGTFAAESGYTQHHRGLPMFKTVDDLDRYRKVIEATRPEVLVETGTYHGGFAAWVADTFGIHVITVDVSKRPPADVGPLVVFVSGDSTEQAELVALLVAGRRCMVSLDSDHHTPHVAAEIRAYGPLVAHGCYLVVEDGLADLLGPATARRFGADIPRQGGPLAAIEAELVGDPVWRRDEDVEALSPVTHHPAGFWVRCG